jgi:hypothetical protein
MNMLDEPLGVRMPNGYLFCPNCNSYENHPLIYCENCGHLLVREKNMTWREFLIKTKRCGAGPIITFYFFLGGDYVNKLSPEAQKIYDEAYNLYNRR